MQLWWIQHRWKIYCRSWYLFVTLPVGVVGLVSFWRGRSVTCQCWILEFGFVLQIFIFSVALLKYYFRLWSLELFLQLFFFLLPWKPFFLNCGVYISPAGDGFAGQSSLGAAPVDCLSVETFHKIILVDFLSVDTFNKIILVDCLSVDSEIFRKSGNSSNNFHAYMQC